MRARSRIENLMLRITARERLLIVTAIGALAGTIAAGFVPWQSAMLVAWIFAAGSYLLGVWSTIARLDADDTREFATREDDSRVSAQLLVVTASVASLFGVAFELAKAAKSGDPEKALLTGVAVVTVVFSWALVHSVFALRYAHLYYTKPVGGIDFKNPAPPDYQDFLYVAFTIGMTFQVSDTDVQRREIRRTVTRHALLAYLFGAVILALVVNVAAALLQS